MSTTDIQTHATALPFQGTVNFATATAMKEEDKPVVKKLEDKVDTVASEEMKE